ncbi:hypothetical protein P154DRAFT_578871 [Amniculicola lignicola CBS 123094]|uniref:Uncharacterized protein n=1 Tax=Amniculicola lignicola CBS 123094 TaxID=1392246 RepID=A0A6A5W6C6_9PLEO|nr:hypothetical protein P154DRAFT_578871 [Amniculicola lignicola CBS 123094]
MALSQTKTTVMSTVQISPANEVSNQKTATNVSPKAAPMASAGSSKAKPEPKPRKKAKAKANDSGGEKVIPGVKTYKEGRVDVATGRRYKFKRMEAHAPFPMLTPRIFPFEMLQNLLFTIFPWNSGLRSSNMFSVA